MSPLLRMTADRRRAVFEETAARLGLSSASVEKDYWVSLTLAMLFSLDPWGRHLVFKGGTSLSKGWKLIERFSEDIDIVIDRGALGYSGDQDPAQAGSRKKRGKLLDALRLSAQLHVERDILPALRSAYQSTIPDPLEWNMDLDPNDPDHQSILFSYPTVFPGIAGYLRKAVKIEMGARSDTDPSETVEIRSLISEQFPELSAPEPVLVRAVRPVRTFWEKVMLLHEETYRPDDKRRRKRGMSRHYYDVFQLIQQGVAQEGIQDMSLFWRIVAHREVYFNYTWMDYSTFNPGSLRIIPTETQIQDWRDDYRNMQGEMLYGSVPSFDEVISLIQQFQNQFNAVGSP